MNQHQRPMPDTPDPAQITSRSAFAAALTALKDASSWSFRELKKECRRRLQEEAGEKAVHASTSGIANWFSGTLPRADFMNDFAVLLRVLGVHDDDRLEAWAAAVRRLRKTPSNQDVPYFGLESYTANDGAYFFGRDALTTTVLNNLDEVCRDGGGSLLLVGASGAGKSSLLNAGVLPALADGTLPHSATWQVISLNAGPALLTQLGQALADRLGPDAEPVVDELAADPTRAADYAQQLLPVQNHRAARQQAGEEGATEAVGRAGHRVLLVIDQFEQALLATGGTAEAQLTSFLTAVYSMTQKAGAVAIFGLRADQYPAALNNRQLQDMVHGREVAITPMSNGELRDIIERPARACKVEPEEGFAELVVKDVAARGAQGAHHASILPLLSHALRKTWLQGDGLAMTAANYHKAGGLSRAIIDTAEDIYNSLSEPQRTLMRTMFLDLVEVHPNGADTRRKVSLSQWADILGGAESDLFSILARFATQGLLTVEADTVEITHESLIFVWPRLRKWLNTDRGDRVMAQRLHEDAQQWDQDGRDAGHLYLGTKLDRAREWTTRHPRDLRGPLAGFIAAGIHYSRRRIRRLWQIIALLTVLFLGAAALTVVVIYQEDAATRDRDRAVSRSIARLVETLRDKDVAVAGQLAAAAYQISPTLEARSALLDATTDRPAVRMRGSGDEVKTMYAVAMEPGGSVVAAGVDTTVKLWNIAHNGHPRAMPPLPQGTCDRVNALAFQPRGPLLAAGCNGDRILLWDARDISAPRALPALTGFGARADRTRIHSVAFSSDGTMLAAAISERMDDNTFRGSVRLWRTTDIRPVPLGEALPVDDRTAAKSVSFHPSNQYLAVGADSGTVRIWDIRIPERPINPVTAAGPTKAVGQLAFSPDGRTLAACGADGNTYLWNTSDPRTPVRLEPIGGSDTWTNALAFSPDSGLLAITSSDAAIGVRMFDVATRTLIAILPHPIAVTAVKFSPDGGSLLTGANDGTARLWPVASPTLTGLDYLVSATRFSPDGKTLAVGSRDLRLFDVTNPQRPRAYGPPITNPDGFSGTLSFAQDGRTLAEGRGRSGTVQIYDIADRARPVPMGPPLKAHEGQVETLAFSSNSWLLATGSRDGAVHLWDMRRRSTPTRLSTPGTFGGFVHWVTFSPDGTLLVAGSADRTVRIWNISDPARPVQLGEPLRPGPHYVYSTVFSPNGKLLAVSLGDSTVHLFDLTDPAHPRPIGQPLAGAATDYAYSVAFTSDSTKLAAAFNDSTIWLWDLQDLTTPQHIATLTRPAKAMFTIDFQPGSDILAAGGTDKTAWLWMTNPDDAIAHVCASTGDMLSLTEWARYVPDYDYQQPCPST